MGYFRQPRFRVTHRGWRVAVNRAEIALPVNQHITHGKGLRHPHHGVINGAISMRMVLTHHVTNDTGGFFIGLIVIVTHLIHRIKHTAMHRLQAVPDIWKGPAYDDAHGVIEVRLLHLIFEINRYDFFREV